MADSLHSIYVNSTWTPEIDVTLTIPRELIEQRDGMDSLRWLWGLSLIVAVGLAFAADRENFFQLVGLFVVFCLVMILVVSPARLSQRKEHARQRRIIKTGKIVKGLVTGVLSYGGDAAVPCDRAKIYYEIEGVSFHRTSHSVPPGTCRKGELITLLIDCERPTSSVIYKGAHFSVKPS